MDEEQTPAREAGDEDVVDTAQTEEQESTDQQVEDGEQSNGEQDEKADDAEVSKAKARREKRKAAFDALRTERDELQRQKAELQARLQEADQAEPAPKRDDFQDYDEYLTAMASYRAISALDARDKRKIEEQAKQSETALQTLSQREQQELAASWADQVADARSKYADFEAVAYSPNVTITEQMVRVMADSEAGADIAYHLGQHPEKAASISRMQPLEMARAIGRLEATVTLPRAPRQTNAPDPVSPVRPKATASRNAEGMTPAEYRKWRAKGGTF